MPFDITKMLDSYVDGVAAPGHLSSKFTLRPGGRHNAAKVMWHARRSGGQQIAVPTMPGTGYNMNERRGFSVKDTAPPLFMEGSALAAHEILGVSQFGKNPFESQDFVAAVQDILTMDMEILNGKIQGAIELMASQVLTTGAISLVNTANQVVFSENFAPKATHFPFAQVDWDTTASAVPLTDFLGLGTAIAADGKGIPSRITMNSVMFRKMLATTQIVNAMKDDQRVWNGEIVRIERPQDLRGAIRVGQLQVAPFVFDIYLYDEKYIHPYTGALTNYIPDDRYIMETVGARMDMTFGGIMKYGEGEGREYLGGGRATNGAMLSDVDVNVWISPDRTVINIGTGTRPLPIPIAIDSFGCGSSATS